MEKESTGSCCGVCGHSSHDKMCRVQMNIDTIHEVLCSCQGDESDELDLPCPACGCGPDEPCKPECWCVYCRFRATQEPVWVGIDRERELLD